MWSFNTRISNHVRSSLGQLILLQSPRQLQPSCNFFLADCLQSVCCGGVCSFDRSSQILWPLHTGSEETWRSWLVYLRLSSDVVILQKQVILSARPPDWIRCCPCSANGKAFKHDLPEVPGPRTDHKKHGKSPWFFVVNTILSGWFDNYVSLPRDLCYTLLFLLSNCGWFLRVKFMKIKSNCCFPGSVSHSYFKTCDAKQVTPFLPQVFHRSVPKKKWRGNRCVAGCAFWISWGTPNSRQQNMYLTTRDSMGSM